MGTVIGASGLEYTQTGSKITGGNRKHGYVHTNVVTIRNIKTGKKLFSISGGVRYTPYASPFTGTKKFRGFDNKYYYMKVTGGGVDWGQIQPDGSVLRENRTILTNLAFYPQYKDIITVPTSVPVPVPVTIIEPIPSTIPAKAITPLNNILPSTELIKKGDNEKWLTKIMKQINQIINQISQTIQSVLSQLKLNK